MKSDFVSTTSVLRYILSHSKGDNTCILGGDFWTFKNTFPDLNSEEWHFQEKTGIELDATEEFGNLTSEQKVELDELPVSK